MEETIHLGLTAHAQERCKLMGISMEVLTIIYKYGMRKRTWEGFRYSMNRKARLRAKANLDDLTYRRIVDKLGFYMIVALDLETVITVAPYVKRHRVA